jgi:3-methyladenine DNA glycosylase AlkD
LARRMSTSLEEIRKVLRSYADKYKAKTLQRFFKTGKGEYAEGDIFLGVTVPVIRKIARRYSCMELDAAGVLLKSPFHEERLLALIVLVIKSQSKNLAEKERIYKLYLRNTGYINNWDLVDLSAHHIVGNFLMDKSKAPLYELARSNDLWQKRIAMLATFSFIRHSDFEPTLKIARLLLLDKHDLIHKAVGWMLREFGKRDIKAEEGFLRRYCALMPRTMLRYSIERFPEAKRRQYLQKGK